MPRTDSASDGPVVARINGAAGLAVSVMPVHCGRALSGYLTDRYPDSPGQVLTPRRPARVPLPWCGFAVFHFPTEVITAMVHWYVRYALSC
jgi:hypothetical protein